MGNVFQSGGGGGFLQNYARRTIPQAFDASAGSTNGASAVPTSAGSAGLAAITRPQQEQVLARAGRSPTILTAPETRRGAYAATKLG